MTRAPRDPWPRHQGLPPAGATQARVELHLFLVAGLIERDGHRFFNVAVLIAPDGQVAGKYRKVCLPDGEFDRGMSPGSDFPVFDTRLGKIGMMICYDGFFPEVARELSNRGAAFSLPARWALNSCSFVSIQGLPT